MQEHPVLGQVLIGFAPMLDRNRSLAATRLTIFPQQRGQPFPAEALIAALVDAFDLPTEGPAGKATGLFLNVTDESALEAVLRVKTPPAVLTEVPAFMAGDPAHTATLLAAHEAGRAMAMSGRPLSQLPREVLPCFKHAIVDVDDDRRTGPAGPNTPTRSITTINSGVRTTEHLDAALDRGAIGVLGWPMDDEVPPGQRAIPPDLRGVIDLMNRVDREEPAEKMEPVLTADPTLAFRLLRYINSAAFGLRVEVTSFKHALMLLGYARLKRWLALLVSSSSKDAKMRPVMQIASRRGLILDELARGSGDDEMRGELFICGVFSLLDRLMKQPMDQLLGSVPVPDRVRQSLLGDGPYTSHLELVKALEEASVPDIRERSEALLLGPAEVNRALLTALAGARQLD